MDQGPKCKTPNNKTLRENIGQKLHNIGFGNNPGYDTKGTVTREEIGRLDSMKIQLFCASKETIRDFPGGAVVK